MARTILLVGRDLNARARVAEAAAEVGAEWDSSTPESLSATLSAGDFDLLILDLDADGGVLDAVEKARADGMLPDEVIGYYSHVDAQAAERARAYGVTPVRRGRFWTQLPRFLSSG